MASTQVHFTPISGNGKTGAIPVTVTESSTCPDNCPMKKTIDGKNGCYYDGFRTSKHWQAIDNKERGGNVDQLCDSIKKLPRGQLWRHNIGGDLFGTNNRINKTELFKLVRANKGKKGFTYTHKPMTKANLAIITESIQKGFIINLSSNNPAHADKLIKHGLPVVTILPVGFDKKVSYTPQGNKIVTCPADYNDSMNCARCQICAKPERDYIIGFPAHGQRKRIAEKACGLSV